MRQRTDMHGGKNRTGNNRATFFHFDIRAVTRDE
jgi:hypothetical protein